MADKQALTNPDLENEDVDVEDEDVVTEDNEEEEELSGESTDITGKEEQADPDGEYTSDFEEWRKDHGLPEDIDSFETLKERYDAAIRGMNEAQRKVAELNEKVGEKSTEALKSQQMPQMQMQPDGKSYFPRGAIRTTVTSMIDDGRVSSDNQASYKSLASVVDPVLDKVAEMTEMALGQAGLELDQLRKAVHRLEWGIMPADIRGVADHAEVEKLLSSGLFDSMDDALKYLTFKKPDMLKNISRKAQERGEQKAQKKFKRNKALRKGKGGGPQSSSWDYKKYQTDGQWDHSKMSSLSYKERRMMLDSSIKEQTGTR